MPDKRKPGRPVRQRSPELENPEYPQFPRYAPIPNDTRASNQRAYGNRKAKGLRHPPTGRPKGRPRLYGESSRGETSGGIAEDEEDDESDGDHTSDEDFTADEEHTSEEDVISDDDHTPDSEDGEAGAEGDEEEDSGQQAVSLIVHISSLMVSGGGFPAQSGEAIWHLCR